MLFNTIKEFIANFTPLALNSSKPTPRGPILPLISSLAKQKYYSSKKIEKIKLIIIRKNLVSSILSPFWLIKLSITVKVFESYIFL
jgi:hypothetical protein